MSDVGEVFNEYKTSGKASIFEQFESTKSPLFQFQADNTSPLDFTMEDVFFTGVLRVKADLGFPEMVPDICVHYNQADKVKRLTHRINKL